MTLSSPGNASDLLLSWYDDHARLLPWRAPPRSKEPQDAYRVWLSEVMLQQTVVATVRPYFDHFTTRWPDVVALANADLDEVLAAWAGLGYYARARNLHKCARRVVDEWEGRFPETEEELRTLPGVGAYTAAAIAAIAFDQPAVVVDGNVERVMARLFAIETPLPDAKPELVAAAATLTPQRRPGDYAQAVMDLGATICTPRSPACGVCPLLALCRARRAGAPETLPRKRPKPPKPTRLGVAYLALDASGRVLLRQRPEKGLLGGMLGLPGPEWSEAGPSEAEIAASAPAPAAWREAEGEALHTFTHFHLRLALRVARVAAPKIAPEDRWIPRAQLGAQALPTLMKKALKLGLSALDRDA
ncbi:MAG: A/G-specific adenine glycosylase [Pseudomonadota bacterium]